MWKFRDLNTHNGYGHVDVPRLIEGNVALQIFTIVTKVSLFAGSNQNTDPMMISDALAIKVVAEVSV